jgi:hypothetical protein
VRRHHKARRVNSCAPSFSQRVCFLWTAKEIRHAVLTAFHLSDKAYGLNQLRYDLRKLKAHGPLERDGNRYVYRLTLKGFQVALLFLLFHKRLCGPLANSRFHHRPDFQHRPDSPNHASEYQPHVVKDMKLKNLARRSHGVVLGRRCCSFSTRAGSPIYRN